MLDDLLKEEPCYIAVLVLFVFLLILICLMVLFCKLKGDRKVGEIRVEGEKVSFLDEEEDGFDRVKVHELKVRLMMSMLSILRANTIEDSIILSSQESTLLESDADLRWMHKEIQRVHREILKILSMGIGSKYRRRKCTICSREFNEEEFIYFSNSDGFIHDGCRRDSDLHIALTPHLYKI